MTIITVVMTVGIIVIIPRDCGVLGPSGGGLRPGRPWGRKAMVMEGRVGTAGRSSPVESFALDGLAAAGGRRPWGSC